MPDTSLLECFENSHPGNNYTIHHISDEFTSVCPKTGHPDFGSIELLYEPDKQCIELKSLKLYYQSFRNEGIFYENVTNTITKDLTDAISPKWMLLRTNWKGRGGIRSIITNTVGDVPEVYLKS